MWFPRCWKKVYIAAWDRSSTWWSTQMETQLSNQVNYLSICIGMTSGVEEVFVVLLVCHIIYWVEKL